MDLCKKYYNNNIPTDIVSKAISIQADITRLVNEENPITEAEYKANFFRENHFNSESLVLLWGEIIHEGYYFARFIRDNQKYHVDDKDY